MSRGAGGRVRLGIIGLGAVAQAVHLPLLSRHRDRFAVTAVWWVVFAVPLSWRSKAPFPSSTL